MTVSPVLNPTSFERELPLEYIPEQRIPADVPEVEMPVAAVDIAERAQNIEYLAKSIESVEAAYKLAGFIKGINAHKRGVLIKTNPSTAVLGARERQANLMRTAKEQFARGAGYTALRNIDGTYPQDVQDDLDLAFVSFKVQYAGPQKREDREKFRAELQRIASLSRAKV